MTREYKCNTGNLFRGLKIAALLLWICTSPRHPYVVALGQIWYIVSWYFMLTQEWKGRARYGLVGLRLSFGAGTGRSCPRRFADALRDVPPPAPGLPCLYMKMYFLCLVSTGPEGGHVASDYPLQPTALLCFPVLPWQRVVGMFQDCFVAIGWCPILSLFPTLHPELPG